MYLAVFEIFRFDLKLFHDFSDGLTIILDPDDLVDGELVELD